MPHQLEGPWCCGRDHSRIRQHHGLNPAGCPGSPAKPSAPVFGTVAISVDPAPPYMCARQPQSVSVHLVPIWAGDMKLKADRVTEMYLNPTVLSIALCPSSGVAISHLRHLSPACAISSQMNLTRDDMLALLGGVFLHHELPNKPTVFPPQAQCRAGVTQPSLEEASPGPEPSCKAPPNVGPATPPHAYPPATVLRGCVGTARSWAPRRVGGLGSRRVPKESHKPGTSP